MAANWRTDTNAIARFADRIGTIPQAMKDGAKDVIEKSAAMMEQRLNASIPVSDKSPHLKSSIEVKDGNPEMFEKIVRVGNSALIYAMSLEFGHRMKNGHHVPANPFYRPVRRIVNKSHRSRMRYALRKALKIAFT